MKYLIIKSSADSFERYINSKIKTCSVNVDIWNIDDISKKNRIFNYFFLGIKQSWRKKLKQYDNIILFDLYGLSILPALKFYSSYRSKLYIWEWNTFNRYNSRFLRLFGKIYSFDTKDVREFGCNYNTQFYFFDDFKNVKRENRKCFFIGVNKGRLSWVKETGAILSNMGINVNFTVVDEKLQEDDIIKNCGMNYENVLDCVKDAEFVLDVVKKGQEGLTLRIMEALCYNKRIITNNTTIKKYSFYDENAVFICDKWNNDKIIKLKEWLNIPFDKYNITDLREYDFVTWIQRFD